MKEFINKLIEGRDLECEEAEQAMHCIMSGGATGAQIGSFLTALRLKGETVDEISSCARVMREFACCIKPEVKGALVDTCGTGGDRIKTFNVSTVAAFAVAGADIAVAKHGNRSVTSKAGSADVLEALGVKIDLGPEKVKECIEEVGIGFMFAPVFHRAMKHAIGPRREMGVRTVFNILGPLTNPANATAQLLGVFDGGLTETLALVLRDLGVECTLVVHGTDGLDELSTIGATRVSELRDSRVDTYELTPEKVGIERAEVNELLGGDANYNAELARGILEGKIEGPKRDIVVLNAGAGIYVGGRAGTLREGIEMAETSIDSGAALEKLNALVEHS